MMKLDKIFTHFLILIYTLPYFDARMAGKGFWGPSVGAFFEGIVMRPIIAKLGHNQEVANYRSLHVDAVDKLISSSYLSLDDDGADMGDKKPALFEKKTNDEEGGDNGEWKSKYASHERTREHLLIM